MSAVTENHDNPQNHGIYHQPWFYRSEITEDRSLEILEPIVGFHSLALFWVPRFLPDITACPDVVYTAYVHTEVERGGGTLREHLSCIST